MWGGVGNGEVLLVYWVAIDVNRERALGGGERRLKSTVLWLLS